MAYVYFSLALVFNVLFGQTLRFGQQRKADPLALIGINYIIGAFASVIVMLIFTHGVADALAAGTWVMYVAALINGTCYFLNMLLLLAAFLHVGVGVTIAVSNSGVLLSMLTSWLIWGEAMTVERWVAASLLVPAMFLMRPSDRGAKKLTLTGDLLLVGLFSMNGLILSVHKWAEVRVPDDSMLAYQAVLFSIAAVVSCGYMMARGIRAAGPVWRVGAVLGLTNAAATVFILLGLAYMPAVAMFPALSCMAIVCNAGAARVLWAERLTWRQIAGMAVAMLIVVLVYLPDWL